MPPPSATRSRLLAAATRVSFRRPAFFHARQKTPVHASKRNSYTNELRHAVACHFRSPFVASARYTVNALHATPKQVLRPVSNVIIEMKRENMKAYAP